MRLLVVFALSFLFVSCAPTRLERETLRRAEVAADPPQDGGESRLRAHLLNGDLVVFERWTVTDVGVDGYGERYGPMRDVRTTADWSVPFDSVGVFQSDRLDASPAIAALTIITGVSAALTVYCLTNEKACFGSCPTFYAADREGDGESLLVAEGYSASIAPSLTARDVDALPHARAVDGRIELRMTNEALETHVTRRAEVLAVPRREGERVYYAGRGGADDGRFVRATSETAPRSCTGPEGDCLAPLAALDRDERTSVADSIDLAARETLTLAFDRPEGERHALLLAGRQSLLTTFLIYQGLAYAGEDVGGWVTLAERRARDEGRPVPSPILDLVSRIDVEVRGADGAWTHAGVIDEVGPLAVDLHTVELPALPAGTVEVRLTLPKGAWRLDAARLLALGDEALPVRLSPSDVLREGEGGTLTADPDALADLADLSRSLITLPGTGLRLGYDAPALPAGADTWELFLETEGYYLEWMRDEWMAERDPDALAEMLYDPETALRRLAPAFKAIEADMERAFWGSRFAVPSAAPVPTF